jgi:hypothetical protein
MKNKRCNHCDTAFMPAVSYQIYCSVTCRELATREKISERYQITRRTRRTGKVRTCSSCGHNLSIYNDDRLCQSCLVDPKEVKKALKELRDLSND